MYSLFLLREPEATLKSIVDLQRLTGVAGYRNPQFALDHYLSRLNTMCDIASRSSGPGFLVESEQITERPVTLLADLTRWLQLPVGLSQRYQLYPDTGTEQAGDPSAFIRMGQVMQTPIHAVEIPSEIVQRASKAYGSCRAFLREKYAVD